MDIKDYAEKEMNRMGGVFTKLKVVSKLLKAHEFHQFAENYYKDGIYFFNEKKYPESFEAFIIAWAYLDIGLKLKYFSVPDEQKSIFTA